jgi:hypothetical protein
MNLRIQFAIFLAAGASCLSAELGLTAAEKALSIRPGRAKVIEFVGGESPLADQSQSAPVSVPKLAAQVTENVGSAFSSLARELKVTNVVLTNDPAYRAVSLNRIPFKQGARVPAELFTKAPDGEVVIEAIEPDRIVFSLHPKKGEPVKADLPYSFSPTVGKRKS